MDKGLGLGKRFADKPLIYPTIYKTIVFSLFVFVFAIIEHFVFGYFEAKDITGVYQEFIAIGLHSILAQILMMAFVFVFFFAFLETGRVLGKGELLKLFLTRRREK